MIAAFYGALESAFFVATLSHLNDLNKGTEVSDDHAREIWDLKS